MQPLAQYALLGSLVAGGAGAIVIAAVTLKHGFRRSVTVDEDEAPEHTARRQRLIRLADTVAVLCFAVSAGLGVVGLMQHTRGVPTAIAASDDGGRLAERLEALESRLAVAPTPVPEWRAWEERIARLESRLGAVEERAAVAERRDVRPRMAPAAVAPAPSTPRSVPPATAAKPYPSPPVLPPPSASPRLSSPTEALAIPEPAPLPQPEVTPRPVAPVTTAAVIPREAPRPRVETPPAQPSLGEKIRRDWASVKDHARKSGDDWREGWDRVKGLFGY